MGRALAMVMNHLGLETFEAMGTIANQEAIELAELMLGERQRRVQAFSDNLGALLGMNMVLDAWTEITSTDPAALLN